MGGLNEASFRLRNFLSGGLPTGRAPIKERGGRKCHIFLSMIRIAYTGGEVFAKIKTADEIFVNPQI